MQCLFQRSGHFLKNLLCGQSRCHYSTRSEAGFRLNLGRSERGHQDHIGAAWTRRHLHHAQHLRTGKHQEKRRSDGTDGAAFAW